MRGIHGSTPGPSASLTLCKGALSVFSPLPMYLKLPYRLLQQLALHEPRTAAIPSSPCSACRGLYPKMESAVPDKERIVSSHIAGKSHGKGFAGIRVPPEGVPVTPFMLAYVCRSALWLQSIRA